jgi:hypothetical protein
VKCAAALQWAAAELSAAADATVYERREAADGLRECEASRATLGEKLSRVQELIKLKQEQLKVIQPEYDRQQARCKAVSQMRSRM